MLSRLLSLFSVIMLFFAGLSGTELTDYMPAEPAFPVVDCASQQPGTLRIMSFNVRCSDVNGTPAKYRRQIIADEIINVSPDSVGLQEATPEQMRYLRAALPGYRSVGDGRDGKNKGEFSAVFYNNRRWKLIDSGMFWLSETPYKVSKGWDAECRRVCTWAVLQNRRTNEEYVHVNSHFDHVSETARRKSAEMIHVFIDEYFSGIPVLFTADLNSSTSGAAYRTMTSFMQDCRFIAQDSIPYGTFHNVNPVGNAGLYLDYVLVTPGIQVKTYRTVTAGIDGRYVSDHFPIYADVVLPVRVS